MFENVPPGPPDPIFTLKKLADGDFSPNKVDLGVGVYRNEQGGYHELEAVKRVSSYRAAYGAVIQRLTFNVSLTRPKRSWMREIQVMMCVQYLLVKQLPDSRELTSYDDQYESTIGNADFLKHASELIFGKSNSLIKDGKVMINIF